MPVETMQQIAEHQLFKAATPVVAAALIGSVTWLFVTVMGAEKEIHLLTEGKIPAIEQRVIGLEALTNDLEQDIEIIDQHITNVRIDYSGMKQQLKSNPTQK
jgi:hypothetical protein